MALIDTSRTFGRSAVFADAVSRGAYQLVARITEWNDARRTRNALSALTAAELDDIGLTRSDVDQMIRRINL